MCCYAPGGTAPGTCRSLVPGLRISTAKRTCEPKAAAEERHEFCQVPAWDYVSGGKAEDILRVSTGRCGEGYILMHFRKLKTYQEGNYHSLCANALSAHLLRHVRCHWAWSNPHPVGIHQHVAPLQQQPHTVASRTPASGSPISVAWVGSGVVAGVHARAGLVTQAEQSCRRSCFEIRHANQDVAVWVCLFDDPLGIAALGGADSRLHQRALPSYSAHAGHDQPVSGDQDAPWYSPAEGERRPAGTRLPREGIRGS